MQNHHIAIHAPKKYACKFQGCDKSFKDDAKLAHHERIHLALEPFKCSWNNCRYSAEQRSNVVQHIRTVHFQLPRSVKEQQRRGIVDQRDPKEFIEEDAEMLTRRLE